MHTTDINRNTRRPDGSGSLYLRGKIWWIKYSQGRKIFRESTGTDDKAYAEDFLRGRMCAPRSRALLPEMGASSQCTVGAIAELTVAIGLMNMGYSVYRAFSHNAPCDLVAIKGSQTLRIEVKTVTSADKIPTVNRAKFDHLALVMRSAEVRFSPPLPINNE